MHSAVDYKWGMRYIIITESKREETSHEENRKKSKKLEKVLDKIKKKCYNKYRNKEREDLEMGYYDAEAAAAFEAVLAINRNEREMRYANVEKVRELMLREIAGMNAEQILELADGINEESFQGNWDRDNMPRNFLDAIWDLTRLN